MFINSEKLQTTKQYFFPYLFPENTLLGNNVVCLLGLLASDDFCHANDVFCHANDDSLMTIFVIS